MMSLTRLFSPPKGRAPAPWDTTLLTEQTDPDLPISITREGELLRRLSLQQWINLAALGVCALVGVNQCRLASQIQPREVLAVIEVSEHGQIRDVEPLPQANYVAKEPALMFVVEHWLYNVRTLGDSRVLLGRSWHEALTFVAPELRPWFLDYIQQVNARSLEGVRVEMKKPVVIPIAAGERTFKAEWYERVITQAGDPLPWERWEATVVMRLAPTGTMEARKAWANRLGILITEIHWQSL